MRSAHIELHWFMRTGEFAKHFKNTDDHGTVYWATGGVIDFLDNIYDEIARPGRISLQ